MKFFDWNYDILRGMDVFFSTEQFSILSCLIRIDAKGFKKIFDLMVPSHSGLISEDRSWFFATEETIRGLRENSLINFCNRNKQIIFIYRWNNFDDLVLREQALKELSYLRLKQIPYDFFTLFTFPKCLKWIRILFSRQIDDDSSEICSETVFRIFKKFGLENYPAIWDQIPPKPCELELFFKSRNDFVKIMNFKK